ncbi:hypothetical protein BGX20_001538 [Mortierella sp. AD010]|nr:hypothetical protein BGX20_001538 [Mortierella sp. AD010]
MANSATEQLEVEGSGYGQPGAVESSRNIEPQDGGYKSIPQKEIFDEEAAFSFRKKRTPNKTRSMVSSHQSPFLKTDMQPTIHSSNMQPSPRRSVITTPTASKSPGPPVVSSLDFMEQPSSIDDDSQANGKGEDSEWELVWKGSWIVPSLEPIKTSSTSASSKKVPASLKKASLDNKQQVIFQGPDGVKLQSNVTELPGIAFAVSKSRQCQQEEESMRSEERQFMRENTEMHLVAKIRLSSFPFFLLMPGCTEPCRVFASPESKTSADFLKELFDHEDIIALLLRVASKPGNPSKKKGLLQSVSKQDDNPFLQQATRQGGASNLSKQVTETEDPRRKLYQDTSMFLVYGMLVDNNPHLATDLENHGKTSHKELPTISFFAYPLVDQTSFSEQILLNTRSLEQIKQDAEDARLSDPLLSGDLKEPYVRYEDPDVDSIMNGSDGEQESEQDSNQTIFGMGLDEDKSLNQEMEILRALERSKTWSPYTVLSPPSAPSSESGSISGSKDVPKDRVLSRSHTLDVLTIANKDTSARSTLSRHKSMDADGKSKHPMAMTSDGINGKVNTKVDSRLSRNLTVAIAKVSRKGLSRMKSPSRAPQQPLDVTTESLRRKLLGPGSVRGGLPSSSRVSPSPSTKSTESSNKATVKGLVVSALSKINISQDHEDFKECAANLYRSVTFAMRKDIASRRYNLEELERLMDRHAALL